MYIHTHAHNTHMYISTVQHMLGNPARSTCLTCLAVALSLEGRFCTWKSVTDNNSVYWKNPRNLHGWHPDEAGEAPALADVRLATPSKRLPNSRLWSHLEPSQTYRQLMNFTARCPVLWTALGIFQTYRQLMNFIARCPVLWAPFEYIP